MIVVFIGLSFIMGSALSVGAYRHTRTRLLTSRPVIAATPRSILTPAIEKFEKKHLQIASKPARAAIAATKTKGNQKQPAAITQRNEDFTKWANYKITVPLFKDGVSILGQLASLSKRELSVEERHNLEVLTDQTNKVLSNFVDTPEDIRSLPAVETALVEQLALIRSSVEALRAERAEDVIREAKIGSEFIRTKFNRSEQGGKEELK